MLGLHGRLVSVKKIQFYCDSSYEREYKIILKIIWSWL